METPGGGIHIYLNSRRLESHFCRLLPALELSKLFGTHKFSTVLLAVVDAKYCFRVVDVGSYGRTSDGGTLANSTFGQALVDHTLQLPEDTLLPGVEQLGPQSHVFVADEAFPLRQDRMRPFPGGNLPLRCRVLNYTLSRVRMIIENTFGILSSQWCMYRRVIGVSPENVDACVKATCIIPPVDHLHLPLPGGRW